MKQKVLAAGGLFKSCIKIIEHTVNNRKLYRHIINPGSVGCPKDGSWHACYAILHIDISKDIKYDPDALHVEFFRLDYDINAVIKAIQKSPLSLYYAGRLLKY